MLPFTDFSVDAALGVSCSHERGRARPCFVYALGQEDRIMYRLTPPWRLNPQSSMSDGYRSLSIQFRALAEL